MHQLEWKEEQETDLEILEFGKALKAEIAEIRKYKSEHNLSMKTELETFTIEPKERFKKFFELAEKDIKACGSINKLYLQ